MKKIYILTALVISVCAAAAQPFAGKVITTCNALEERDGYLYLELDVYVARKAMNTTQSWRVVPQLCSEIDGQTRSLPSLLINGRNKRQIYERRERFGNIPQMENRPHMIANIDTGSDTTLHYVLQVPYEEWMDDSRLVMKQILTSCRDQQQLFTVNIADAMIRPRPPYAVMPRLAFIIPMKEELKHRSIHDQAFLEFRVNRSEIIADFRGNNAELDRVNRTLQEVRNTPDAEITAIYIEGYASPEGSFNSNLRLSGDRAESFRRYLSMQHGIPLSNIRVTAGGEDWIGLRRLVAQSNIDYKQQILEIIDSDLNPDTKEARMKVIGGGSPYRYMLANFYPQLRRADYRVDFTVKDFDVTESRSIFDTDPSLLSHYELFVLANSYPEGSAEYEKAFDLIIELYPDDDIANINTAAVLINKGNFEKARLLLANAGDNPQAYNNLGVIALYEEDFDAAARYFRLAHELGSEEALHNLGETEAKRADAERRTRRF